MKLLVVGVSFFLSFSTLAEAGGAPPPRMPSPEGQQPQSQPETTVRPAGEPEIFAMPSGNIGCIYTPAGGTSVYQPADGGPELACDIVAPRYVRATLGRAGAATLNHAVGDPSCCSTGTVLDYGQSWSRRPFSCVSERTGLSCRRDDGHSFLLSRAQVSAN
ncbi:MULTISPECIES: hypothetical protein [Ensifer]|jgi:hypothetical protein|uniref:Uncharacterized protein n=1 Tax=Ensifer adhaerens TaxID=106592 RepID=A0ABY8HE37_ENSAD|nr:MULTISPECIES: hypothetical protein [Ensifer]KDP70237.1 hypothetical protein FA04_28780 [Ensifer adhaerens]MDF8355791.1 hypothetical protein [Ensifer adhaerens]QHG68795.1 hypothetical protein DQW09_02380 [Ensifer adhaerens]THA63102.1 hypothetical protein E5176_21375 [Ensifer adhaerens]WFP89887.1 hypothetical protein P4B07_15140 [Ensifer adhaerens]